MRAFSPSNSSEGSSAEVALQVRRNKHAPRFESDTHDVTIREDVDVNGDVVRMAATDDDSETPFNALTFELVGDDTAPAFFAVDEQSGSVTLTRSLVPEEDPFYIVSRDIAESFPPYLTHVFKMFFSQVRVVVSDGGTP